MQVIKFGGSSVANAENIKKVIAIIQDKIKTEKTIAVVSALGGITDLLLLCSHLASLGVETYKEKIKEIEQRHLIAARELIAVTNQSSVLSFIKTQCNEIEDICNGIFLLKELSARTKDRMVSYGELLSSKIITAALENKDTQWVDARELIVTNDTFGNAAVNFTSTNKKIQSFFKDNNANLFLVPGFISANEAGIQTTLGRGGSDYTAAIFAAALHVSVLEIWTDVSGMMTADPRLVANAKIIPQISYQEAMELSHFGAKVIYPPTIQPVDRKSVV